jgi:signal transduction histidine kinase
MKTDPAPKQLFGRIIQYLVMAYQAVVFLAMLAFPLLAIQFFQQPFLGVFLEHTLVSNGVGPETYSPAWELYHQLDTLDQEKSGFGYQLISIAFLDANQNPLQSLKPKNFSELEAFLADHQPGEQVQVTFRNENPGPKYGQATSFTVSLAKFPASDQIRFFILPYLVALVYFFVSLWIFGIRRTESAGRAFSLFASSIALVTAGLLNLYTTNLPLLTYLWILAVALVGGALFHLGLVFPQEARIMLRYPFLRLPGYLLALGLTLFQFASLFDFTRPVYYALTWKLSYLYAALATLFFVAMTLYRFLRSSSPVVRQQARTILLGALTGFGYITIWMLLTSLYTMNFNPYLGFLPLTIFPATTGYTVLRYRLMRTDYLVSRTVLYTLLILLTLAGYILLAFGFSLVFGTLINPANPLLIALTVILAAFVLNPVRAYLQQTIDAIFFRGEKVHQQQLGAFTRSLARAVTLSDILRILREQITNSLLPNQLHIFIYNPLSEQYFATPDEAGHLTSDIRFEAGSPLPLALRREQVPIFISENRFTEALQPDRGRLALLATQLFIPLAGRERLIGWIALGERLSGEAYAHHDIAFLETLGSQSAVALERAQVLTNMERRVGEMNALARVAQGINITLNFDDILELIYAQTAQIMSLTDLHITLHNKTGQYFYHAFCLEADERLSAKENSPLPPKTALEQEVIQLRRVILAQDFTSQCQAMGLTSPVKGLFAWLGVPLNTGAETIGALSIASRDPAISYTNAQAELLQSIADQAAGAIVKSRLLQETERRAQQLATLNVITRQLTSTMEIEPLLHNILENAVNILNAETGSLFLVDEQTDELVFRVTVGPVARNLVGQRLPAGSGVVGDAVNRRTPIIVNDVATTTTWSPAQDKQTGFVTRSILAVPMEVKDKIIGVIEIINKKDGSPFTEDDQNLLAAFGGQAAVAFENARLFTLTDQELAARVEELSVMQRIDRELNASLEVSRTMRITLEWALRQSGAEAGLIGFVQPIGVQVMASQGYKDEITPFQEHPIPLEHAALREPIASGQLQQLSLETANPGRIFLKHGHSQMVLPIRRESRSIGLLLLESTHPAAFAADSVNFISRLADHAAIAISNAQLYDEVQQANIAKSEFVSFVAHELKNPMTSIKGYSELLAAGAVGQITDMQANFLGTIRSNIERMKTIVEDLNDNSKIEAGRMRLDFKAVEIPAVIENVIRSTRRQIEEKKQTIEITLGEDLPPVWADRTRIEQILVNLISNAHKYTPEGGHITVSASRAENEWDPQGAAAVVHLSVRDNGIGLAPEDQRRVFQKFFRSEDDQARKSPGTGLGLNITKSLIEMQGGKIWFETEFRQGTVFHFTIPVSEN